MPEKPEILTVEALAENYPELVDQVRKEALAAGETAGIDKERARVQALKGLTVKGFEAIIADAIDTGKDVNETSVAVVKAIQDRGVTLDALENESELVTPAPAPISEPVASEDEQKEIRETAEKIAEIANASRK